MPSNRRRNRNRHLPGHARRKTLSPASALTGCPVPKRSTNPPTRASTFVPLGLTATLRMSRRPRGCFEGSTVDRPRSRPMPWVRRRQAALVMPFLPLQSCESTSFSCVYAGIPESLERRCPSRYSPRAPILIGRPKRVQGDDTGRVQFRLALGPVPVGQGVGPSRARNAATPRVVPRRRHVRRTVTPGLTPKALNRCPGPASDHEEHQRTYLFGGRAVCLWLVSS